MLENTSRNRNILAGVAGVTLALGLAVSVGAVPRPGDSETVRTAAVGAVEQTAAPAARQPGDTTNAGPAATTAPPPAAAQAAAAAPATTVAKPKTTVTTKAPATTKTTNAPVQAAAPSAAPAPSTAASAPVKVPRRTPSAAEVQSAINQLKQQVGGLLLLVSPTPAQIAQAGDQICTAFDNGQTFAQVKATGLSMIPASITVSPATADWAVRTAVALYCPGHANKLV